MVVMFVGCLVLVDDPNIVLFLPYKSYGAGFFVPAQILIAVKLLNQMDPPHSAHHDTASLYKIKMCHMLSIEGSCFVRSKCAPAQKVLHHHRVLVYMNTCNDKGTLHNIALPQL